MFFSKNKQLLVLMKFSILITSYNKGKFIEEAIKSCIQQTYKDFEIVVMDNESIDHTDVILNKYSNQISVIKNKRISKYPAVNQIDLIKKGSQICSGEIICLLDADDFFNLDKLEKLKDLFQKDINLEIIFDIPIIRNEKKTKKFFLKKKKSEYIWPTIIPTSSISIKKNLLKKSLNKILIDKYNYLEIDFRICVYTQKIIKKFLILDKELTNYRIVLDGIMANNKKFSYNWWKKRQEAHNFMFEIYKENNLDYKINLDCFFTNMINKLIKTKD